VEEVWNPPAGYPGPFNHPHGVRVDAQGRIYVADTYNNRVERLTPTGAYRQVWYVPVTPPKPGIQNFPYYFCSQVYECGQWAGMAIGPRGQVYVTDTQHNLVFKLSPLGAVRAKFGGSGSQPGQFHTPEGIAVSSSGTVYVADTGNHRVEIFAPSGRLVGTIQKGLVAPADVLIAKSHGPASILDVADSGSGRVLQFSVTA
jgi:DNA-binding beta-propeller fold protein YncE